MKPELPMFVLLSLLFTAAGVNAMNNISEAAGPYMVSLSLPEDINVTINTTTETSQSFFGDKYTNYNLNLRALLKPDHIAAISIMENGEIDLIYLANSLLETMDGFGYTNVTPVYREIGGNSGILVVGSPTPELPQIHGFVYLFDNQTPVVVRSTFPWDNGTSMMLETLHISKVG